MPGDGAAATCQNCHTSQGTVAMVRLCCVLLTLYVIYTLFFHKMLLQCEDVTVAVI